MDTKEIKGGRDEFVIMPPGTLQKEKYKHTGSLHIQRSYNLNTSDSLVSGFQTLTRAKRNILGMPSLSLSSIPGWSEIQNIIDQVKEIFENPVSFVTSKIPSDLSSFKDMLGKLEDIAEFALDNALKTISEELSKMEFTEEKHFQVTFFRSIDPTSLHVWTNRRMTGCNVSWHYKDQNGKKLETVEDSEMPEFKEDNLFYVRWVNTIVKAEGKVEEEKLWEAIKKTRKEFVDYYLAFQTHKYRRLPPLMVGNMDIASIAMMGKLFFQKSTELHGDLIKSNGTAMMKTFRDHAGIDFTVEEDIFDEENLPENKLLKATEMFLYLFSLPRNAELSLTKVWKIFYKNLFTNYPAETIVQTLTNFIKPELKSRRTKDSVAEKLFGVLDKLYGFEYGMLDVLMSTSEDIFKRKERIQFSDVANKMNTLLGNETGLVLNISKLSKITIIFGEFSTSLE